LLAQCSVFCSCYHILQYFSIAAQSEAVEVYWCTSKISVLV
jgi:hypothetical protein